MTVAGAAFLSLAALLVYYPALHGGFVVDDNVLLTDNPLIKAADGLYRIWFTTEAPDYWPMSNTMLWFEWRLWGMSPTGYHVTNLLLHVVSALLLWWALHRLAMPGAFLAALLFAVHPVNVETVAWIAQRKTLLAFVFCLLSFVAHQQAELASARAAAPTAERWRWYGLSLIAFTLAMLSKATVATYPFLLLCTLSWKRPLNRDDFTRILPFLTVAALSIVINLWFRDATHGLGNPGRTADPLQRLLGAGAVVWFYLGKALLPFDLIFIYPEWNVDPTQWPWWLPALAAAVTTAALWWHRHGVARPVFVAWLYFCLALLPVMGFTDVGYMQPLVVADHYQHVALLAVVTPLAALCALSHRRLQPRALTPAVAVALVVVAGLMLLSWRQSHIYVDGMTLYQATLARNPRAWLAHTNLGSVLFAAERREESISHYREAARLRPDFPGSHYNLAVVLARSAQLADAVEHLQEAIAQKPDYLEAHYSLALVLADAGRSQEAIEAFRKVVDLSPTFAEAHYNLGALLIAAGKRDDAITHWQEALRLNPRFAEADYNLAGVLIESGRLEEAIPHYERALANRPDLPGAHYNLARVLLALGRVEPAISHFQQAVQVAPDSADAHGAFAAALHQAGRNEEAIHNLRQALRIAPDHRDAEQLLERVLALQERAVPSPPP